MNYEHVKTIHPPLKTQLDIDLSTPYNYQSRAHSNLIERRIYNKKSMNRNIMIIPRHLYFSDIDTGKISTSSILLQCINTLVFVTDMKDTRTNINTHMYIYTHTACQPKLWKYCCFIHPSTLLIAQKKNRTTENIGCYWIKSICYYNYSPLIYLQTYVIEAFVIYNIDLEDISLKHLRLMIILIINSLIIQTYDLIKSLSSGNINNIWEEQWSSIQIVNIKLIKTFIKSSWQ
jgi:hypothetical protein